MTTKGKMYGFWIITRPGVDNGRTPVYVTAESEQRAQAVIPERYGLVEFERMAEPGADA